MFTLLPSVSRVLVSRPTLFLVPSLYVLGVSCPCGSSPAAAERVLVYEYEYDLVLRVVCVLVSEYVPVYE